MSNFNLLISTSRFNETNADAELWFTLLICGDEYPIISKTSFPGLITALTSLDSRKVINKIQDILRKRPDFFQFILKIVPIDFVCETSMKIITKLIQERYNSFIKDTDSFKIVLKRRKHEKIARNNIIEQIAKNINNNVDLENPDKVIRVEVLGNYSGVSILEKKDVISIKRS
ncbi:MAG: THUMP domain-containing protein [Promethearchaeota archaeon]|jgi:tRNA acetyltransferase TAN1